MVCLRWKLPSEEEAPRRKLFHFARCVQNLPRDLSMNCVFPVACSFSPHKVLQLSSHCDHPEELPVLSQNAVSILPVSPHSEGKKKEKLYFCDDLESFTFIMSKTTRNMPSALHFIQITSNPYHGIWYMSQDPVSG